MESGQVAGGGSARRRPSQRERAAAAKRGKAELRPTGPRAAGVVEEGDETLPLAGSTPAIA
eukprot:12057071-Alexandrium_andersonii.AAC.1